MAAVLEVRNLEKVYAGRGASTRALAGVSLSAEKGDFVGIMGASGSGKTTLLNCIATIDAPTSGTVFINGQDVTKLKSRALADFRREELGFVFQNSNLLDTLTCRENIALPQLVLADEPTGALDSKNAKLLLECFEMLNKQLDATILMVTHDSFAASYCKRVVFIRDGRVFTEVVRGDATRKQFFDDIMRVVAVIGGDETDDR